MSTDNEHVFINAVIKWKEDLAEEYVTFCIGDSKKYKGKPIDESIFFYLESIEEIKDYMQEDNGQDFIILNYEPERKEHNDKT